MKKVLGDINMLHSVHIIIGIFISLSGTELADDFLNLPKGGFFECRFPVNLCFYKQHFRSLN